MYSEHKDNIRRLREYDLIRMYLPDLNGISLCKLIPSKSAERILKNQVEIYSGIIAFGPRFEVRIRMDPTLYMYH